MASKEKIKARLLKSAARIWDVDDSDIETTFDPVVAMLIEGCVNEFQKINDEIDSSQARLLSRLAQLLTPDAVTGSSPAHAIIHAATWERTFTDISVKTQFYAGKKAPAPNNPNQEIVHEVYFSPATETRIFSGSVAVLAANSFMYEIGNVTSKKLVDETQNDSIIKPSRLWIGLSLSSEIRSLENLCLYIDWRNNPEKNKYFAQLAFSRWYVGDHKLEVQPGLPNIQKQTEENQLLSEFDLNHKIESQIIRYYSSSFVHIASDNSDKINLNDCRVLPDEIKESFEPTVLSKIPEDLLWLRVEFPNALPAAALNDIYCSINCFPVINRKLNEFTYRLNDGLNLIAMPASEEFLSVHNVLSDEGYEYKNNPLTNSTNDVAGTYILRQGGVERFDVRNATQLMNYLLDLLRDESAAFSVMGNDFLSANLKQLNQIIAVLEQRSVLKGDKRDATAYLIVNPKNKGENLFLTFWSTNGDFANGFRAGTKLEFYMGADITSEGLIFITSSTGGRPKLNDLERLSAYKNTLTSRDRIVTMQDIKMFCLKELSDTVADILVSKGFIAGADAKGGFTRVIEVAIIPSKKALYTEEEWESVCNRLEIDLQNNSSGIIPIKVKLKKVPEMPKSKIN
ncbi:MAG: hypothetical protein ACK5P4_04095 [Bacteroidota bacterium]